MTQAGASSNPLNELVKLLAEDQSFTSVEIAETLWLAIQLEPTAEVVVETPTPDTPPTSPVIPPDADVANELEWEAPPSPTPEAPPRVDIATPSPQAGVLPPQTLPVWLADPAMLTDSLAVISALRPLLQKVEAGTSKRLDEVATVDMIARTRLCLPVMEPDQEPWFDIVLVVDRGTSMHIWQRLVKDIVRILRRYGAFRDVQVYDLAVQSELGTDAEPILLISNPQQPGHRPSELIDQRGRRIAIFLSDCAGAYWWDGTLLPMLQAWGQIMPTVVWQMLPPWMWKRTALGTGASVALRNDLAGAANQRLQVHLPERDRPEDFDERLPLPVVTSEITDLARWSLMVAGDHRAVTPGFLLPQSGGRVPKAQRIEEAARDLTEALLDADEHSDLETAVEQALEEIARDRVEQFFDFASPQAQRLMMLLAAAPVITLPVVRLIRDAMIYDARSPLPVAEVFLSGLLQRLPGQADTDLDQVRLVDTAPNTLFSDSQDLVQYDFIPKVRQVLLEFLPEVDTLLVINSISAAVERRWNQYSEDDFQAFLRDPNASVPAGLEGVRSFASITADILEQLGGGYSDIAQELRLGSAAPSEDSKTEPADDWLADFLMQDFEYEVAEYTNFPPLELFDFIEVELVEEADFPPPLQLDNFKIVTIELQLDSTSARVSEADAYRLLEQKESEIKQRIRQDFEEQEINFQINMHPRDVDVEGIDVSKIKILSEQEIGVELIDTQLIEVGEANIAFRATVAIGFAVSVGYFDYESYRSPEQEFPHWYQIWPSQTLSGSAYISLQILWDDFEERVTDAEVDSVELQPDTPVWLRETTELEYSESDTNNDLSFPPQSIEVRIATLEKQADEWHIVYQSGEVQRDVEPLSESVELELIAVPGGTFRMGSPEDEPERYDNEGPQHEVTVSPFFMGRYPITQAQWRVVTSLLPVNRELNPDPSQFKGDSRPVEFVSWEDAVEFCERLSAHTDRPYRLPSEAEWEYACRAGTTTPFHFGDMITTDVANYSGRAYPNGPQGESRGETTPVDHFGIANAFGLSDMHGNVLEWCADHWHENYEGAPIDGSAWIEGGNSSLRVLRGGSWSVDPRVCRSANRDRDSPGLNFPFLLGFRVVCSPPRT